MEISNRHVLLTGGAGGIGRAFANSCAHDACYIYLISKNRDEELIAELLKAGAKSVQVIEADVSSQQSIEDILPEISKLPVDLLFNGSGIFVSGLLEKQDVTDISRMMQINVTTPMVLAHAVLSGMLERKRGKIINCSNVSAYMNFPCTSSYAGTKAAVIAFTNSLRHELKETGVSTLLLITPSMRSKMVEETEVSEGTEFEIPSETMSSKKYAEVVREAILHDLEDVEPSGLSGLGFKMAKFAKPLVDFEINRRFKRS